MPPRDNTFAAKLRRLRERAGVSQRELARRAGLTGQAVALLESGRRAPLARTARALADALGVRLGELI